MIFKIIMLVWALFANIGALIFDDPWIAVMSDVFMRLMEMLKEFFENVNFVDRTKNKRKRR